jgi:acetoin:2,6-dichlorophenolindophenol oxidoreductase subunit beta
MTGKTTRMSMSAALSQGIQEEMRRNPKCLVMGEDMRFGGGLFGVSAGLIDEFGPDRVIDMPISEAGFCGFATGCAIQGYPAIVEVQIFDFIILAMDQLCNHAAKMRYMSGGQMSVPLVVRGPCSLGTGLAAQHSQSLEAWFMEVAGLKVVTPATASDAKGLIKAAIRDPDPVVFMEHRLLYETRDDIPEGDYVVPLGSAKVIKEGADVTLIANSIGVRVARAAVQPLADLGIDVEVIDLRTVKPLDSECVINSVLKTHRAVVVSGGTVTGGVASHVTRAIMNSEAFESLKGPIGSVGVPDVPIPFARELERAVMPQAAQVVEQARRLVHRSRSAAKIG